MATANWTFEIIYTFTWNLGALIACMFNLTFILYHFYCKLTIKLTPNAEPRCARSSSSTLGPPSVSKQTSSSVSTTVTVELPACGPALGVPTKSHSQSHSEETRQIPSTRSSTATISISTSATQKRKAAVFQSSVQRGDSDIATEIQVVSVSAIAMYTVSTIFSCFCTIGRAHHFPPMLVAHSYHLLALFWLIARLCMYLLFIIRLQSTFKGSNFAYSKCTFICLYSTFSVMLALFLATLVFAILRLYSPFIVVGMCVMAIDVVLSTLLLVLFIRRLIAIFNTFSSMYTKSKSNIGVCVHANEKQSDSDSMSMLETAARITSVTFVSLMFNFALLAAMIVTSYYEDNGGDLASFVINGTFNGQVIINAMCVALYFRFSKRMYRYSCCVCHVLIKSCLRKYAVSQNIQ